MLPLPSNPVCFPISAIGPSRPFHGQRRSLKALPLWMKGFCNRVVRSRGRSLARQISINPFPDSMVPPRHPMSRIGTPIIPRRVRTIPCGNSTSRFGNQTILFLKLISPFRTLTIPFRNSIIPRRQPMVPIRRQMVCFRNPMSCFWNRIVPFRNPTNPFSCRTNVTPRQTSPFRRIQAPFHPQPPPNPKNQCLQRRGHARPGSRRRLRPKSDAGCAEQARRADQRATAVAGGTGGGSVWRCSVGTASRGEALIVRIPSARSADATPAEPETIFGSRSKRRESGRAVRAAVLRVGSRGGAEIFRRSGSVARCA